MISVIVPNYNHAPFLHQRIESILSQSYQDIEIILLDDCSSDDSRRVLLEYRDHPKVSQIVLNDHNSGSPFAQWNKGVSLAKGEWIWIAESDDWAEPDFLETLMNEVSTRPNVGLAYTLARYVCDGRQLWEMTESGKVSENRGEDFVRSRLVYANVIYNVSMTIFRKEVFEKIDQSLYDSMRLCGDWFFYAQLCHNTDVLEVQKVCSNYRVHGSNTSSVAEKEGLSFLEGLDVLEYMKGHFDLTSSDYSRVWGRQWAKYSKKYHFSSVVNCRIKKRTRSKHKLILLWFKIYTIRLLFR